MYTICTCTLNVLAQSILGFGGFKFVQMMGHTFPKGNQREHTENAFSKSSSPEPLDQFKSNLAKSIVGH